MLPALANLKRDKIMVYGLLLAFMGVERGSFP